MAVFILEDWLKIAGIKEGKIPEVAAKLRAEDCDTPDSLRRLTDASTREMGFNAGQRAALLEAAAGLPKYGALGTDLVSGLSKPVVLDAQGYKPSSFFGPSVEAHQHRNVTSAPSPVASVADPFYLEHPGIAIVQERYHRSASEGVPLSVPGLSASRYSVHSVFFAHYRYLIIAGL